MLLINESTSGVRSLNVMANPLLVTIMLVKDRVSCESHSKLPDSEIACSPPISVNVSLTIPKILAVADGDGDGDGDF